MSHSAPLILAFGTRGQAKEEARMILLDALGEIVDRWQDENPDLAAQMIPSERAAFRELLEHESSRIARFLGCAQHWENPAPVDPDELLVVDELPQIPNVRIWNGEIDERPISFARAIWDELHPGEEL